jgi:hypothetical protein
MVTYGQPMPEKKLGVVHIPKLTKEIGESILGRVLSRPKLSFYYFYDTKEGGRWRKRKFCFHFHPLHIAHLQQQSISPLFSQSILRN